MAPALAFLAVCLGPYLERLRSPSLYADDVVRVAQLRNGSLGGILFVPFNEHVAPLFQVVSWVSWQLAGRQLARAPLVFTLASFLPLLPTLGLLAWVIRRETGSITAGLAGLAVFSLSWLQVETVYWYSASSFMWSLLATLAAWLVASSAAEGRWRWGVVAALALASASAPAFSAIGLLAGPVAAVRVLASARGRRRFAALAPLAGTLVTLAVYHAALHDPAAPASNVGQSAGIWPGLMAAAGAPAGALMPALLGLRTWSAAGPVAWLQVALTLAASVVLLIRARRGHDRPLILGGLALVVSGYVLTFCARAGEPGRSLLETQRYHLFPMLGLVMLLAAVFRPGLGRWDARPIDALRAATALAAVLFVLHYQEMKGRARFLRYPDQVRTLAAIDRLGDLCARNRISRAQTLAALDPIETAWTPVGHNALILLAPGVSNGGVVADNLVKSTLLAALTPAERRSLCGGMDATPYLRHDYDGPGSDLAVGRRVALYRIRESGADRYVSAGWPSFIEYDFSETNPSGARALGLAGSEAVDVWWRGERQRWSETRSVRLRPEPARAVHSWLLPLARLPHWDTSEGRRIRFLYHAPGPIAVRAPRLVR